MEKEEKAKLPAVEKEEKAKRRTLEKEARQADQEWWTNLRALEKEETAKLRAVEKEADDLCALEKEEKAKLRSVEKEARQADQEWWTNLRAWEKPEKAKLRAVEKEARQASAPIRSQGITRLRSASDVILSSTAPTRAGDYTGCKVMGRRVHQVIRGAQRVERTSVLTRKHPPPAQDVRRWCTARIDASTVTLTVTCNNAPWCYLQ